MRVLRATHLGMCFGVRDAIALALEHAEAGPLTILGDLVHNPTVLNALAARGVVAAPDIAHVSTDTVMVTAHGTSRRALARTRALGLTVVEATCPLVHVAHRAVAALVRDGYHVVIVGQRDHVEVRGLTGDLDRFDVVLNEDDVPALDEHPRIGVAAQTTQSIEKVRRIVACIRQRFPASDVRFLDTVCKPTKERQTAAVDMAKHADVVIVVGGATSNNTRELVKTCAQHCARVHHVQTEADLRTEWLLDADVVGLTAGTSTPDEVIDRVEAHVRLRAAEASASAPASADASAGHVRLGAAEVSASVPASADASAGHVRLRAAEASASAPASADASAGQVRLGAAEASVSAPASADASAGHVRQIDERVGTTVAVVAENTK